MPARRPALQTIVMKHMLNSCFRWPGRILTLVILQVAVSLPIYGQGYSQEIVTLSEKNASLIKVLKEIKRQTGYSYVLTGEIMELAPKVSIEVKNVRLIDALQKIFGVGPIGYIIVGKTIVVKERKVLTG
jgi:TonB-dependent starch-binding outer membrane protein SusC